MGPQAKEPRQHMSTLTNGWRFTLPTAIRRSRGWDSGTRLVGRPRGTSLILGTDGDSPLTASASDTNAQEAGVHSDEISPVECYLGSGGKIVLPLPLRESLGWVIGKRLVIVDEGEAVAITLCCDAKRCESCGSVSGVREIIPKLYLCSQCWQTYLQAMNRKLKWSRPKA